MLKRSTIQLLRFHFSFFLLPVYLFALSQLDSFQLLKAGLIFAILHLLVYPSSNGYNSYMDRDESAIGGLKKPLQPTRELFIVSVVMDAIALFLSLIISWLFTAGVLLYILASRAYSYRGIRLKQYPVIGYLTVILFQGVLIFLIVYAGAGKTAVTLNVILQALAAGLLIGGSYPLTQIYQHEEDRKDNVTTISMLAGIRGSFVLCAIVFTLATALLFLTYREKDEIRSFYLFVICMAPVLAYFFYWARKVWHDKRHADFSHSLTMNVLASVCMTIYFSILLFSSST